MKKVLITTVPFANKNRLPLELLERAGIEYTLNPLNKKLTEDELFEIVADFDVIIAGTEQITSKVMDRASNLKMISRVGMGLDSVDLSAAKQRGIKVSFTPDAPAPAVAELTVGLMLSLLRSTHIANAELHRGEWVRHYGRRISEITIGIIGVGRIGQRVLRCLSSFGIPSILVNDLNPDDRLIPQTKLIWTDKEEIYKVKKLLEKEIESFISTGIEWIPILFLEIKNETKEDIINFIENLEDNDDVQNVYSNAKFID